MMIAWGLSGTFGLWIRQSCRPARNRA